MRKFNQKINRKIVNFWRRSLQSQWLLLLVWTAIATCLRLTNLASKPPWTDEFSTLVFSLGNNFQDVPLNRAIAPEILLQPLQPDPNAGIRNVVHNLLTHSNHPPVYFILSHWWLKLFPSEGGLVSLWGGRSLSVIFSIFSIPAIYGLGRLAFRSRLVGQLAAAIIAVSPYSIYLAQEARHYSLAILFVIASLSCLIISIHCFEKSKSLPIYLAFTWVFFNSLGIAVHYFFSITICAEIIVLISIISVSVTKKYRSSFNKKNSSWKIIFPQKNAAKVENKNQLILLYPYILSLDWIKSIANFYIVIFGSLAGGLVWLPFWNNGYSSELTEWISISNSSLKNLLSPIFQFLATNITMLFLLPIESPKFAIAIICFVVMILFLIWIFPLLLRGINICLKNPDIRLSTIAFRGVILVSGLLFFGFTYILGIDLTRGARYSFVYFPAMIILVAAILAQIFNTKSVKSKFLNLSIFITTGKKTVILIWLIALLSGLTVVSNLGYQKYYRPDLLVSLIQKVSDKPVLIATLHQTHVETGELMGIAWNMKKIRDLKDGCIDGVICNEKTLGTKPKYLSSIKFILVDRKLDKENQIKLLQQTLNKLESPLDLWLVNFSSDFNVSLENCQVDRGEFPLIDGYEYQLYHCHFLDK
ncbi:MAG: glycosyltransferase [Microcoleaceae cyanobacterium MO_207.B10]|nr:glycosyltransferase [Microcoleaceae cyanobacterium MO_207.B10]